MASGTIEKKDTILIDVAKMQFSKNKSNQMPQFRFIYENGDQYQIAFASNGNMLLQRNTGSGWEALATFIKDS